MTAFNYIIEQGGVSLFSKYPYKAVDTLKCAYTKSHSGGSISSYEIFESGNETLLQAMLVQYGPISVAIDASLATFQSYKAGVYFDKRCSQNINHAVLLGE